MPKLRPYALHGAESTHRGETIRSTGRLKPAEPPSGPQARDGRRSRREGAGGAGPAVEPACGRAHVWPGAALPLAATPKAATTPQLLPEEPATGWTAPVKHRFRRPGDLR